MKKIGVKKLKNWCRKIGVKNTTSYKLGNEITSPFSCTVTLPSDGRESIRKGNTKSVAKRNAALRMLHVLREEMLLKNITTTSSASLSADLELEEEKTQKLIRGCRLILNKLTPDNFDKLKSNFINNLNPDTFERLEKMVDVFFNKAIEESLYAEQYAKMSRFCHDEWQKGKRLQSRPIFYFGRFLTI